MTTMTGTLRRRLLGRAPTAVQQRVEAATRLTRAPAEPVQGAQLPAVDIAGNDPLLPFLASASGAVEIVPWSSTRPALAQMKAVGVTLVVPC
jgi:hypothetical protein